MAARGARTAGSDAGDRLPQLALARGTPRISSPLLPQVWLRAATLRVRTSPSSFAGHAVVTILAGHGGRIGEPPRGGAGRCRGEPSALAAKRATSIIPIVVGIGGDPIRLGLVESFNHPGGNATGVTLLTNLMEPKRLGLLRELVPGVPIVGVLLNPNFAQAPVQLQQIEDAARSIDQRIVVAKASTDEELEAAFAALTREGIGGLLVTADPYFDTRREQIVGLASRQRVPAIYQFREYAVAGGLMSYGVSITDAYLATASTPRKFLTAPSRPTFRCTTDQV